MPDMDKIFQCEEPYFVAFTITERIKTQGRIHSHKATHTQHARMRDGLTAFLYFFFPFAAVFFFDVAAVASAILRQSSRVSFSGTLSLGMR